MMKDLERRPLLDDAHVSDRLELSNIYESSSTSTYNALDIKKEKTLYRVPENQYQNEAGVLNSKRLIDQPMTLTWRNLTVRASLHRKKGKFLSCFESKAQKTSEVIINKVSGIAKAGSLLVIMGSSGSGKTTLLNCLTRRNLRSMEVEGHVFVNGRDIGDEMSSISSYVQQDDLFIGTLTVREHLWFNVRLRLGKDISDDERNEQIEKVLKEMGLKKCEHTLIGEPGISKGISGGEKKRLAFAAELLTNPSLMFCDEPTSGLDSVMARSVVQTLKNLANNGRTIVATIHQPSSDVFALFDELLIMSEGRVVFMGSNKDVLKFFADMGYTCPTNYNPADFLMNTLAIIPRQEKMCRDAINVICNCFEESSYARAIEYQMQELDSTAPDMFVMEMEKISKSPSNNKNDINKNSVFKRLSKYESPWIIQLQMLLWRSYLDVIRNKNVFPAKLGQLMSAGLLLGALYWQQPYTTTGASNFNGAMFMMLIQSSFNIAYAVVVSFTRTFPMFVKEHHDGQYCVSAYYIGKLLVDTPFSICCIFLYATCTYWMIGFYPAASTFFIFCAALMQMCLIANSYSHFCASLFEESQHALLLLPFLLGSTLLFSGFLLKEGTVNKLFVPIEWISAYRYTYAILLINQWKYVKEIGCDAVDDMSGVGNVLAVGSTNSSSNSDWCYTDGMSIITSYRYDEDVTAFSFGMNFVILFCVEIIGYLCLRYNAYKSK